MSAQLRLWCPTEGQPHLETEWQEIRWDGSREAVPVESDEVSTDWRWSEFFLRYFRPAFLFAAPAAQDKTICGYYDAVRYSVLLGGDPLLADVDAGWLQGVRANLGKATFARGKYSPHRPLSRETQAKHWRQLSTIARELQWLELIPPIRPPRKTRRRSALRIGPRPKPAYTVPQLRLIVSELCRIRVAGFEGDLLRALWRSVVGLGFYTGLRREALLSVTWAEVELEDGVWWLHVPAEMTKDAEPWDGPIYPALVAELCRIRGATGKLLPWPYGADWLTSRFKRGVQAANIPLGRGRDLQGLRRAHEQTLLEAGFDLEKQTAARLLNHSDPSTTFGHYAHLGQLRAKYIRHMPAIW